MSRVLGSLRESQCRRANRVALIGIVAVLVLFGSVLVRVVQLQVSPSTELAQFIQQRQSRALHSAPRGDLLDRRGRVLAATRPGYRIFVDPYALADLDVPPTKRATPEELRERYSQTIQALSSITGLSPGEVSDRVLERVAENRHRVLENRRPIRYVSVGLTLDDAQLAQARDLDIRGVALERRSVRESSSGELVAKLIGDVGVDHNGLLGAELRFDDDLEPAAGYMDYIRDAQGRPMWVEAGGYAMPQRGSDVRLSIDLAIQKIAIEELERGMADADSAGGRVVVADPMTGEVLAMADLTRDVRGLVPFDGELATKIKRGEAPSVRFVTLPDDPGKEIHPALSRNRCVEDVYEPGSTFKSFMWAEVLQRDKVRPDEVFNTHNGLYKLPYGRRTLNDVTKRAEQTWLQVLINSSNIGMAQGTARMSFREMRDAVLRFGFGSKTEIGLPGESAGIVTSQRDWSDYTQTSVAMGHEVAVTPVQMVRAFSVFARDGELAGTLPTLTMRATDDRSPTLSLRRQVIDAWIAQLARETMVDVFDNMVRMMKRNFPDDPEPAFVMFGKSGTAEIPRPDGRGYFEGQYNSSFILGAPVERPRVVVLVVIDDPGPEMRRQRRHYGSQCAGPVAARVAERVLRYMGIAPQEVPNLADASTISE